MSKERVPGTTIGSRFRPDTDSIFGNNSDLLPYRNRMEKVALGYELPIFWQRPDTEQIYVSFPVTNEIAITLSDLQKKGSKARAFYGGYDFIPEGMEENFNAGLLKVLQQINSTNPKVTLLRVRYQYRDYQPKFFTVTL